MIDYLKEKVIDGNLISIEEALLLSQINNDELETLFSASNDIREAFMGNQVDLCTIMNAKSGGCSEDCKFCAQSSHYSTNIPIYPLVDKNSALKRAIDVEQQGAYRFSLVTSGKGIGSRDFLKILTIYETLKENTTIKLCSSLGIISYEKAKALREAGVTTYHHNIETNREYYSSICTTHSYDDRIETIRNAQRAGLSICSGGIIGLGESMIDRIKMAFELRELGVQSVPINILTPIGGTPLANIPPLSTKEVLKTLAIFRFILPRAYIRLAGGRILLEKEQAKAFKSGANAAIVGDYLTTIGNSIQEDIEMLEQMGFKLKEKLVV